VVAITGASAGVGRAVAHAFARRGARLGLIARGREGLEEAAAECEGLGGTAIVLPTDVSESDQVEAAADELEKRLGPIDVWVNDAMSTVFSEALDTRPAEFERATRVTYLGTVHGTMAALHRMVPRNRGTVVQVGSALAYRAIPLQSAYCGAKFGIRGFTDSVRTELLHRRSRCWITMVQLPAVNTPQFGWCLNRLPWHPQPVPPIYQPEVPAEAIYHAAHHRRREYLCGGSTVKAVWGNKLFPGLLDRYLARSAYEAQQMVDRLRAPSNPANLFSPVPELARTHGIFDQEARTRSYQAWISRYRAPIGVAISVTAAAAALIAARNRW
jgi:short-subunit dehydrogenase